MQMPWKPCLSYQTSYFIYQSFFLFHGELNLPHPSFAMQERVFYLRLSTEPKLTLNLYINAISIKITQNIYPLLSSKMKRTEQQEYINIPLPIGLAKEIDDIIK